MRALALLLVVAASAQAEERSAAPVRPDFRLHVGGQVGLPFFLGVNALGTFFVNGRPRFDVDVTWEPSVQLQSYSVGGAYQVLDRAFFVGARLRLVQYQPPWARGGGEPYFGVGGELGGRIRVGEGDQGVITLALHGSFMPGQAANLAALIGVTAGFAWGVWER